MIDIDISMVYQLINFLFLIWILNIILYKPIRKVLRERKERIGALEADILGLTDEVESKNLEVQALVRDARAEGYSKKEELKTQGMATESEIIGETTRKTESEITKLKGEIAGSIEQARKALKTQVNEFSRSLAEKILGREIA